MFGEGSTHKPPVELVGYLTHDAARTDGGCRVLGTIVGLVVVFLSLPHDDTIKEENTQT